MAYVDEARIQKFMPHFPKIGEAGYTASSDFIAEAIIEADAIVDAHLAVNYTVPFNPVPPLVRFLSTQIAVHQAFKMLYPGDNIASNSYAEKYEAWEENAYKMLRRLQKDELALTNTAGSVIAVKTGSQAIRGNQEDYHPVFDKDEPEHWGVDADQLEEISNDRG